MNDDEMITIMTIMTTMTTTTIITMTMTINSKKKGLKHSKQETTQSVRYIKYKDDKKADPFHLCIDYNITRESSAWLDCIFYYCRITNSTVCTCYLADHTDNMRRMESPTTDSDLPSSLLYHHYHHYGIRNRIRKKFIRKRFIRRGPKILRMEDIIYHTSRQKDDEANIDKNLL